jgi:hypothetical protein
MNWLDMVLAAIIVASTVFGVMKGFFRLGIGLIATLLAFLMASWFYSEAGEWAIPYTSSRGVANFVVMITAFLPGDPPPAIFHSQIAPYILDGARLLSLATPADMKNQFRQTYEKTKRAWVDPVREKLEKLEQ